MEEPVLPRFGVRNTVEFPGLNGCLRGKGGLKCLARFHPKKSFPADDTPAVRGCSAVCWWREVGRSSIWRG